MRIWFYWRAICDFGPPNVLQRLQRKCKRLIMGRSRKTDQRISVYSQNMQGGSNVGHAISAIRQHTVTLLQESGTPSFVRNLRAARVPGTVSAGIVNLGTCSRPVMRHVVHHHNGRCSQTVLIDADFAATITPFTIPAKPGLRPMVGAVVKHNFAFASFHAPSGNAAAAEGVLRSQLKKLMKLHKNFVAFGDANSGIERQAVPGSIRAFAPGGATHQSGSALDGGCSSMSAPGWAQRINGNASDHLAVRGEFYLSSAL